eukprot:91026_1
MGSCLTTLNVPTQSQVQLAEQLARNLESNAPLDPNVISKVFNPHNSWFKDYQQVEQPAWLSDYLDLLAQHLSYSTDENTQFLAVSDKLKRLFKARESETDMTWENSQGEQVTRVPTAEDLQDQLSDVLAKLTAVLETASDVLQSTSNIDVELEKATLIEALTVIQINIESHTLMDPRVKDGPWNVAERYVVKIFATNYNALTDSEAFEQFMIKHQDELEREDAFSCSDLDDNSYNSYDNSYDSYESSSGEYIYDYDYDDTIMDYNGLGLAFMDEDSDAYDPSNQDDTDALLSLVDRVDDSLVISGDLPVDYNHNASLMDGVYEPYGVRTELSWSMLVPLLTYGGVAGCILGVLLFCLTCCSVSCSVWIGYRCFLKGLGQENTTRLKEMIKTAYRGARDALSSADDIENPRKKEPKETTIVPSVRCEYN